MNLQPSEEIRPESVYLGITDQTLVYWLGAAGVLINTRGTIILIDPIISLKSELPMVSENGYKLLITPPVSPDDLDHVDAVMYTHADDDHLCNPTAGRLLPKSTCYHATRRSADKLLEFGVTADKIAVHRIGDQFDIDATAVEVTGAEHPWPQNPDCGGAYVYGDCCGFLLTTPDGRIWLPGDTQLLPEHLRYRDLDLIIMDFSEDIYHFGKKDALHLANHYRDSDIFMYHYGTFDAPGESAHNADPAEILAAISNPSRFHIIPPGTPYILSSYV